MTQEEKLLQKIQGLFFFAGAIAGVFLNLFLFQLGNFRTVVIFDLITLVILFIMYLFSGKLLQRFSSRTLIRAGLMAFILEYFLLFLLRERAIDYVVPLAIIMGLGHGSFWPGNNLSQYIITHSHSRNRYFGQLNFWLNIGLGIGPIIGGGIIYLTKLLDAKFTGYALVFLLVALVDIYIIFLANKLPRHTGIEFKFNYLWSHRRSLSWKIVLTQQFLWGLFDVAFATLSGVLIFLIVKTELSVGIVRTVSSILFAVASIWAGNMLQRKNHAYLHGMLGSSLGLLIFGLGQNWWGVVGLTISNLFAPFLPIATSKTIYDVIDQIDEPWQRKYHFLVERDSILGLGRIFNYVVILLLFTPTNQVAVAKTWVLVIPVFPLLIGLLQWLQYRHQRIPEVSS